MGIGPTIKDETPRNINVFKGLSYAHQSNDHGKEDSVVELTSIDSDCLLGNSLIKKSPPNVGESAGQRCYLGIIAPDCHAGEVQVSKHQRVCRI
jgi:hypothetical protein